MNDRLTRVTTLRTVLFGTLLVPLVLLASSPAAQALARDDGDDPGDAMGTLEWIAWFIGGPVLLFALITLLVMVPGSRRKPRYRPGGDWQAEPLLIGGPAGVDQSASQAPVATGGAAFDSDPADPAAATGAGSPAPGARQSASPGARPGADPAAQPGDATTAGGGASARW